MKIRKTISINIYCSEEQIPELLETYKQKGYELLSVKENYFKENEEEKFTILIIKRLEEDENGE